jgi:hypothetical protein
MDWVYGLNDTFLIASIKQLTTNHIKQYPYLIVMDNKDEIIAKLIQDVEEIKKEITQMKQRRQFRSEEKEQELKDRRKETNRKYYLKKKELKKQSVQNI